MDLKQLETFVHVAEMGSFTRAAAYLQLAQPALSRQVRALEVEMRQTLLQRNGRGVTLTEGGKRLLAHARGILQQVQRARDDLEDQRGAATGRLAIALPPSVSRTLTGPLVRAFRAELPRASLCIVEGLSAYALEWLVIGRVDAAVVYNVAPSPAIELQPLLDEPLYLVSACTAGAERIGAALSLSELAEQALVIPSRPHSMRMLLEAALAAEGRRARVALEIESVPAILDLVQQGGCHALLTENAIRGSGQPEAFALRPLAPPLVATLWLATSAQRPRGPLLERGAEIVQALLRPSQARVAPQVQTGPAGAPA
ncbi:MAG: LysR family transcriptional regulator [Rubrivivax sp. SCN 71-131]|jgi:LysR family nitrogen assimilation transcriptional regulator|nr:MAG: LysR family transcriptional regulator [Rubrivivax sp. SCN 71-131]